MIKPIYSFALVCVLGSSGLHAQVLDQEVAIPPGPSLFAAVTSQFHRAQTFTVGTTGLLHSIAFHSNPTTTNLYTIDVRTTIAGQPIAADTPLVSRTLSAGDAAAFDYTVVDVSNAGVVVNAGQVLAIAITYNGMPGTSSVQVNGRNDNPYSGGQWFQRDTTISMDWNSIDPSFDMGFQTYVLPLTNDDCANAIELPHTYADTPYFALGATTDGADATGFCDYGAFGDDQNYNDVWFTYTPEIGGCTYISTLNLAGYDTRLAVYDSTSCPDHPGNIIACVDEEDGPGAGAPFEAGLDVNLLAGVTYLIRLGTFDPTTPAGSGVLRIAAGPAATNATGPNPGAPGCVPFPSFCNGDGGDQAGCTDCPCSNNATLGSIGGCAHSASGMFGGRGSRLVADGDPSISLPVGSTTDLVLSMENMPPNSTAVLCSSSGIAPLNSANPCFGYGVAVPLMDSSAKDGLRCASGDLLRHGNRQSDTNGEISDDLGSSRTWGGAASPHQGIAGQAGFVAGQTRYFQATHRDRASEVCMTGLNTSQAVEVTFTP